MSVDVLAQARGWCAELGTVEDGDGSFVLNPEDPTRRVKVASASEIEGLVVRSAVPVDPSVVAPAPNAPSFEEVVRGFAATRAGLLAASVEGTDDDLRVRVELPIYEDGVSRHAVLSAVAEIRKAVEGVRSLVEDFARQRELLAGLDAIVATSTEPEPALASVSDVVPATSAPASTAPAATSPPAWARTHVVPAGGMPAWDAADPARQPLTTLQATVELQVVEWLGAWAHVRASNGWTGWVDGRNLVPAP